MLTSDVVLGDWHGDVTLFQGFYNTRPASEIVGAAWGHVAGIVAPESGPSLVAEKAAAVFFVPCNLISAPLAGKTLTKAAARGLSVVGKQRSAAHVGAGQMLVADLDGISPEQLEAIEARLIAERLTYLAFSSFSHGRPDKPGMRCRIVIPVDARLDGPSYKRAAQGANVLLLDGAADPSGFALHQQQGTWATTRDRARLGFRRDNRGGVCRAAVLLSAAPAVAPMKTHSGRVLATAMHSGLDVSRLNEALHWVDADEYGDWIDAAIWLKAAHGDAGYPVWLAWSETADKAHKEDNEGRYAPETVWGGLVPRITAEQGAGALFARARDGALLAVREAAACGVWGNRAKAALVYLRRYHARLYNTTFGVSA